MKILKALIHPLTDSQKAELAGNEIVELKNVDKDLATLLSNTPGDWQVLNEASEKLCQIANDYDAVLLPGGSPAFAWSLAQKWQELGVQAKPMFAHSIKDSVEKEEKAYIPAEGEDGLFVETTKIVKTSVFNHQFWF